MFICNTSVACKLYMQVTLPSTHPVSVGMSMWQGIEGVIHLDEGTLHACGTSACFAGWLAVSPEWQADGGYVGLDGSPRMIVDGEEEDDGEAIAHWLGIPIELADKLCCCGLGADGSFYEGDLYDVTPQMVIDKLQQILEGESWIKNICK